jgi:hypothetical protein
VHRLLAVLAVTISMFGQVSVKGMTVAGGMGTGNVCGVPNFCSPTNTNVDQTSAPAALIGLTGVNATTVDAATGNIIIRATDYSLNGGTTGNAAFRANSDSNDNVWSISWETLAVEQPVRME